MKDTSDPIERAESIVEINEFQLDRECIRLPTEYLRYAHLVAEAKRKSDEAKAEMEVVRAELDAAIRDNPQHYKLDKVTEAAVKAVVLTRPKFQDANKAFLDSCHHVDMLQAVVSALETKKRSLQLLVELHGMSYFADPKLSENGKKVVAGVTEKRLLKRNLREKDIA